MPRSSRFLGCFFLCHTTSRRQHSKRFAYCANICARVLYFAGTAISHYPRPPCVLRLRRRLKTGFPRPPCAHRLHRTFAKHNKRCTWYVLCIYLHVCVFMCRRHSGMTFPLTLPVSVVRTVALRRTTTDVCMRTCLRPELPPPTPSLSIVRTVPARSKTRHTSAYFLRRPSPCSTFPSALS